MTIQTSRRGFLKGASAVAATALMVGYTGRGTLAAEPAGTIDFTPFVKITPDGNVTAIVKHFEMGQGTSTGLTTLIAEELDVDLDEVEVEFAPFDNDVYHNLLFGMQGTGGSTALANSFMQYRKAGAAARAMLIEAAAKAWGVDAAELTIDHGVISGAGKSAPIADFVTAASTLTAPEEPPLKRPEEFKLIGNPNTARRDNHHKTTGTGLFAMDMQLPGQIVAVIKRSPKFGGKIVSVDAEAAKDVPGFINAVAMPTGAGAIVFAKDTWSALQARDLVEAEWDFTNAETRGTDELKAAMMAAVNAEPELVARKDAEASEIADRLANADTVIEKDFFFPYLAHAPMEPLTCTIEPTAEGVTVHDGCQFPIGANQAISAVLQLPPEKVKINTVYAGGSFGRRATMTADYHVEAALAFAMSGGKQPVKLVWSREDDLQGGYYRPAMAHKVRVGLDSDGTIVAWDHRIAGQSIFKGTAFEDFIVHDGIDHSSVEGVPDTPYALPGMYVGLTDIKSAIPVNWWRSVGNSHTGYVMESMMDEAAKATGRDPLDFRLAHLEGDGKKQQRLAGVLKHVADKAGWGTPPAAGRSRGIAGHFSFESYVAEVVEISRDEDGVVKIEKVTCAVDCGLPVNPDVIKAQMEGGIGYGLGAVMRDQITLTDGEVDQFNFPDYEPLRIGDIAAIETHIVASTEPPTGVGEPGVPPAGPALANAIAADGPRVTTLPMSENGVDFA